jgi:hypothetical protein
MLSDLLGVGTPPHGILEVPRKPAKYPFVCLRTDGMGARGAAGGG